MSEIKRPLRVFLFHAPPDKLAARDLYLRLITDGVDAWLVKEKILPSQDWKQEIHNAVSEADVVLVCLSRRLEQLESRQREVWAAFDSVIEQLDDKIFVIPVCLETCDPPENLRTWQLVDLSKAVGYETLVQALRSRAEEIGAIVQAKDGSLPQTTTRNVIYEQQVPDEKPVEATQGRLEVIEGAGILIEDPAAKEHNPVRGILLAMLGIALILMMAWFGPEWIETTSPATPSPERKATQAAAPATRASPEPIPIPTLTGRGNVSHIVFLIDTSGSMQGQKIRNVKAAASDFVSRLGNDYLVSVIEFDTNVELRMPPTRDHAAASGAIESITVDVEHNGSCVQDALYAGSQGDPVAPAVGDTGTIMIVLNDVAVGDYIGSDCGIGVSDGALTFALSFSLPIFSIYVGDDFLENSFAVVSGGEGTSRPAQSVKKINEILLLIAEAAGLELNAESVIAARTTDAHPVSMLFVPPGDFIMGNSTVFLNAFWIDKTEVTNDMYAQCVQAGECNPPRSISSHTRENYYGNPNFGDHPVIYVSWLDANAYCGWAGGRLPTEAEWEKAARGTDGRAFPWGDVDPSGVGDLLNFYGQDTTPVGLFPRGASPYGALDMAGNVSEWVADWYSVDYYNSPPSSNPLGPDIGEYRVWRGGSWANTSTDRVRTYSRTGNLPTDSSGGIGFRCARDAGP